jgi:hypothetical protein
MESAAGNRRAFASNTLCVVCRELKILWQFKKRRDLMKGVAPQWNANSICDFV